jgi:transcription initiation factor IIE alpha subunit
MTKNQTIELLEKQLPSFYSLEQVISLIKGIEEETPSFNEEKIGELLGEVETSIETAIRELDNGDIIDFDSVELTLNYDHKIEIEDISINPDVIQEAVQDAINKTICEFFNSSK